MTVVVNSATPAAASADAGTLAPELLHYFDENQLTALLVTDTVPGRPACMNPPAPDPASAAVMPLTPAHSPVPLALMITERDRNAHQHAPHRFFQHMLNPNPLHY